jgi:hypothetical protein
MIGLLMKEVVYFLRARDKQAGLPLWLSQRAFNNRPWAGLIGCVLEN